MSDIPGTKTGPETSADGWVVWEAMCEIHEGRKNRVKFAAMGIDLHRMSNGSLVISAEAFKRLMQWNGCVPGWVDSHEGVSAFDLPPQAGT